MLAILCIIKHSLDPPSGHELHEHFAIASLYVLQTLNATSTSSANGPQTIAPGKTDFCKLTRTLASLRFHQKK